MRYSATVNGTEGAPFEAKGDRAAVDAVRAGLPATGAHDVVVSCLDTPLTSDGELRPAGPITSFSCDHGPAAEAAEVAP